MQTSSQQTALLMQPVREMTEPVLSADAPGLCDHVAGLLQRRNLRTSKAKQGTALRLLTASQEAAAHNDSSMTATWLIAHLGRDQQP